MKKLPAVSELQRLFTLGDDGVLRWNWRNDTPCNINRRTAGNPAGTTDGHGHRHVTVRGAFYQVHRIVWALANGADPYPHGIDHKNGDRSDNRPSNLRLAGQALNVVNSAARGKLNCKGAYQNRPGSFVAQTKINGRTKYLGKYATAEEAHEVYCLAVDLIHGPGAYAR